MDSVVSRWRRPRPAAPDTSGVHRKSMDALDTVPSSAPTVALRQDAQTAVCTTHHSHTVTSLQMT